MRQGPLVPCLVLLALGAVLGGCGDSHEDAAKQSVDLMEELAVILEGIRDEPTAKAAAQKVDAWIEGRQKLQARLKAMGALTPEEEKAIEDRLRERKDALSRRIRAQLARLTMDPTLRAHIGELMSRLPAAMGK